MANIPLEAKRGLGVWLVLTTASLISACSSPHPNFPVPTLASPAAPVEPYVLQVGDIVGIKFYQNPDLNEELVVRPDGKVSLQLINDIQAAGLTPDALAADLTKRYTGELANPRITVIVRQFGGQRVYVGGEVKRQGVVILLGGMTLLQAIDDAGGLLDTAHRKQIILIRRSPDGKYEGHEVDLRPVLDGTDPSDDVPLQPYDVVFVPRSKIANVNLFVDQYITKNIPPIPVAIPIP